MTSLPIEKIEHFTEAVDSDWVNISPSTVSSRKYRDRSGAFAKATVKQMSHQNPIVSNVTKGFAVKGSPSTERKDLSVRRYNSPIRKEGSLKGERCQSCIALLDKLAVCTELNELLMKKFGQIMQLTDKGKRLIESFEQEAGLKPELSGNGGKTNPIFIASQGVCMINEEDKKNRRESGLDYMSIDLTNNMFPISDHPVSLSELDNLSRKLYKYLDECREISLSSANLCFDSRFGSPKTSSSGLKMKPPLQRMHTLSNSMEISQLSSSMELSLEPGRRLSPLEHCFVPHQHSDFMSSEKPPAALRRTHSENELLAINVESRVLLMDPLPTQKELTGSNIYNRGFSSPGDQEPDSKKQSYEPPFRSHLMSVLRNRPSVSDSFDSVTRLESIAEPSSESTVEGDNSKPLVKGLTGEESVHVLDKIASLEQQRLSLLTELEAMKEKNNTFWETLEDLRSELDEKDLRLKLLSADVMLATTEMNKAKERTQQAEDLRQERDRLMDRLRNSEDESKAVKDSLVQLVTEKAATNKALTIENQRLRNMVKQSPNRLSSQSPVDLVVDEPLSADDEFRMQGLFAELNGSDYVHKQGFLVKQGHKMKNWKRRMFVLDNHSLSYYKTEQPLGTVPLEEISKVQEISSSSFKLQHMFEIHRNDPTQKNERIYYLSAPTHDEMQSWIGIIQTLKDTKRHSLRQSVLLEFDSPVGSPENQTLVSSGPITGGKPRSLTSTGQNSLTLPAGDRISRQRKTVVETGVRNRMFTDTGQRRTDIPLSGDTSDEEETRSPLSASSDEETLRR